ncbi:MAG: hypothetical protein F2817_12870 [Actinobacteria bacterium]|nr:hypothetical protein [Actinomycetota bacterium]
MRTTHRPRHRLHPVLLALLRPVLRYSYTREAYVLRLVGNDRGPVFVTAEHEALEPPAPSD